MTNWSRRTASAARTKPRVRADRHRRVRRGPLFRRHGRIREGRARRHSDAHHCRQPRPGGGRRCTCCRSCGRATSGRGTPDRRRPLLRAHPRRIGARATTRDLPTMRFCEIDAAAEFLFCENETNTQPPFRRPTRAAPSRTGSTITSSDGNQDARSTAIGEGTKCAAHVVHRTLPAGGIVRDRGCGFAPTARRPGFADFDAHRSRCACAEADEFYAVLQRRHRRPRRAGWCSVRRSRECCGASSSTTSTFRNG